MYPIVSKGFSYLLLLLLLLEISMLYLLSIKLFKFNALCTYQIFGVITYMLKFTPFFYNNSYFAKQGWCDKKAIESFNKIEHEHYENM